MEYEFEISRILFGAEETAHALFFVEVVFRTLVMYLYTIVLARMVGHDAIGQIGPFEFVLVIAVGSAAGDPMFYPDIGLLQGILVITVVIVLHRLTGALTQRARKVETLIEGTPQLLVSNGEIQTQLLGSGSLTERELMTMLRLEGIRDLGQVEEAWFETNGRLSVFRSAAPGKSVRSTRPAETTG